MSLGKKKQSKQRRGTWTSAEDELLTHAVSEHGAKNWKKIADLVPGRSDVQCLHRWQKVLNPELVKGPWTEEEDNKVRDLVKIHGAKKWSLIASHLPGRIGKQCRERWTNHLDPQVKKGNWEEWEDELIVKLQKEVGNKWARIAKHLPGRTDNDVKNRFNSTITRRMRQEGPNIFSKVPPGASSKQNAQSKPKLGNPSTAAPPSSTSEDLEIDDEVEDEEYNPKVPSQDYIAQEQPDTVAPLASQDLDSDNEESEEEIIIRRKSRKRSGKSPSVPLVPLISAPPHLSESSLRVSGNIEYESNDKMLIENNYNYNYNSAITNDMPYIPTSTQPELTATPPKLKSRVDGSLFSSHDLQTNSGVFSADSTPVPAIIEPATSTSTSKTAFSPPSASATASTTSTSTSSLSVTPSKAMNIETIFSEYGLSPLAGNSFLFSPNSLSPAITERSNSAFTSPTKLHPPSILRGAKNSPSGRWSSSFQSPTPKKARIDFVSPTPLTPIRDIFGGSDSLPTVSDVPFSPSSFFTGSSPRSTTKDWPSSRPRPTIRPLNLDTPDRDGFLSSSSDPVSSLFATPTAKYTAASSAATPVGIKAAISDTPISRDDAGAILKEDASKSPTKSSTNPNSLLSTPPRNSVRRQLQLDDNSLTPSQTSPSISPTPSPSNSFSNSPGALPQGSPYSSNQSMSSSSVSNSSSNSPTNGSTIGEFRIGEGKISHHLRSINSIINRDSNFEYGASPQKDKGFLVEAMHKPNFEYGASPQKDKGYLAIEAMHKSETQSTGFLQRAASIYSPNRGVKRKRSDMNENSGVKGFDSPYSNSCVVRKFEVVS